MHPTLIDARRLLDATCGQMTPAALAAPYLDRWSAAEVLEHLAKAFAATAAGLETCRREQRAAGRRPTAIQRVFIWLILSVGYFPPGREAPPMTLPDGLPPDQALEAVRTSLDALDGACTRSLEAFGPRLRVTNHPRLGGFTVGQWRRFHLAHTRHHMRLIVARRR